MSQRRLTLAFAVAQLIAWGPFYYSLPVFVEPIAIDQGWGREFIVWALSAALLSAVVAAPLVGARIDSGRGRSSLIIGHALGALCLLGLSQAQSAILFFLLCCCLGLSQAACLYDAAFSLIHRHLRADAGPAIVQVTLVAGLSGTVFVPLTQFMVDQMGWRTAMAALAVVSLLPTGAYFLTLPRSGADARNAAKPTAAIAWSRPLTLLVAAFGLSTAAFSAVTIGFLPLMIGRGLDGMAAAQLFALVGPAQIAGRLLISIRSRSFRPFVHGPYVFAVLPIATLVLIAAGTDLAWLVAFALLFGLNSGLSTIVRGTAPAELCDVATIGRVNGVIGAVGGLCRAAAPALFALTMARLGADAALVGLLACAVFAFATFLGAARLTAKSPRDSCLRRNELASRRNHG